MPLPRPLAPTAPPREPGAPPPKSLKAWVGKIAPSVPEDFMRALLEACGPVADWKPVKDADTGRLRGFGFCTWKAPEAVAVALKVLNNLNVDGQELAVKADSVGGRAGALLGTAATAAYAHPIVSWH